jgi:hypothetical protein
MGPQIKLFKNILNKPRGALKKISKKQKGGFPFLKLNSKKKKNLIILDKLKFFNFK